MTSTPPGWYDDGHGAQRWWDGAEWTEHVATPDAPFPGATGEAAEVPGSVAEVAEPESPTQSDSLEPEPPIVPASEDAASASITPASSSPDDAPYAPPPAGPPDGYPGGYPVVSHPSGEGGAFISATEPRKSKLWIVWVVLGAVLLAIVVALAVLLPMAFRLAGSAAPEPSVTEFTEADQQLAIDAVLRYDQAYQTADCDAYMASTTQTFRELSEITDCDTFLATAAEFADAYQDYEVTVTSVSQDGESLSVFTSETYTSPYDDEGNVTEQPQSYEDVYEYVVVPTDAGWAINDAYFNP